jgi:GNAT superfamily N-acetyltransferase
MKILPYKEGDEHFILDLFECSFGKKLSLDYWNWRFANHPSGLKMIMLMWDEDRLVGHYALSPMRLIIDQQEILTALSMTTMTHPDYAGKGIFTQLANALYEEERSRNGLTAVWGYPNVNSHYGFIKNLQWSNLEQIPTFSINADVIKDTESNITVAGNFRNVKRYSHDNSRVRVLDDLTYLSWRYERNPSNSYFIFEKQIQDEYAFAIVKKFDSFTVQGLKELDVLEWQVPADEKLQMEFLHAIKKHFSDSHVQCINMWMPLNDRRHIQLEKLGFRNRQPITYFGIRLLDSNYDALLDGRNWQYSLGCSDIY